MGFEKWLISVSTCGVAKNILKRNTMDIKKVRELAKLNYSLHYQKLCSKPLEHSTTIPLYEGILVDLDH